MPKRTNEFQRLIFEIQRQLAGNGSVTESKLMEDRQTQRSVEVDIVIETSSNGFEIIVSLEVRSALRAYNDETLYSQPRLVRVGLTGA